MTETDMAATDVAIDAPTPIVSVKPVVVSARAVAQTSKCEYLPP